MDGGWLAGGWRAVGGWLALPAASVVRGRMGMDKSQGNANLRTRELFAETSQNPVLLETVGFMTSQWHVPSLPQLPRTSATLRSLWAQERDAMCGEFLLLGGHVLCICSVAWCDLLCPS